MAQTYTLRAGMQLTVSGTATGYIARLASMPGGGDAQEAFGYDGTIRKLGPYPDHERFLVDMLTGAVTVSVANPDMSTDAEVAAVLSAGLVDTAMTGTTTIAALTATNLTVTNPPTLPKLGNVTALSVTPDVMVFPSLAPVNAVPATVTILTAELDVMNNDEILLFAATAFTKKAATDAVAGEFLNAVGLAACINELLGADWTAAEAGGAVTVTRDIRGLIGNSISAVMTITQNTTAGGDAGTAATTTIGAGAISAMAAGDTLEFDGNTFTKVASAPGATEFTNVAGLLSLIHALTDWTAVDSVGDILVTAAALGAEWNGIPVMIVMTRTTAGGIDGTVGLAGTSFTDNAYLYVANDDNTTADINWRRIDLGSTY